jgi:hypothetical protein
MSEKTPEDIVADAMANALRATGAEVVVLFTIQNDKARKRSWGSVQDVAGVVNRLLIRHAADLLSRNGGEELIEETEEVAQ